MESDKQYEWRGSVRRPGFLGLGIRTTTGPFGKMIIKPESIVVVGLQEYNIQKADIESIEFVDNLTTALSMVQGLWGKFIKINPNKPGFPKWIAFGSGSKETDAKIKKVLTGFKYPLI